MQKKFNLTMHHFRGIAIIFVAAEHLLVPYYINSDTGQVYRFLSLTVFSPGSVLFAFIAGYLSILIESNRFDSDHLVRYGIGYIKKKIKNVYCPMIVVSLSLYAIFLATGHIYGNHDPLPLSVLDAIYVIIWGGGTRTILVHYFYNDNVFIRPFFSLY